QVQQDLQFLLGIAEQIGVGRNRHRRLGETDLQDDRKRQQEEQRQPYIRSGQHQRAAEAQAGVATDQQTQQQITEQPQRQIAQLEAGQHQRNPQATLGDAARMPDVEHGQRQQQRQQKPPGK